LDLEWLLRIDRSGPQTLGVQLRTQLREAIRSGALRSGARLPSTRSLAAQLGVSRPIIVEVYEQLAAEGYLQTRRCARPIVGDVSQPWRRSEPNVATTAGTIRFDLRPAIPDLGQFPRKAWLKAVRLALERMPHDALGYDGRHGTLELRQVLADYLGRVRGVITTVDQIIVTSGFAEARMLACGVLKSKGVIHLAIEDPSYSLWETVERAGLVRHPIPVDAEGLQVNSLWQSPAQAVFVTPAHQFPTGVVLQSERRQTLVRWLRDTSAYAFEDDYDAEFRYDHAPVGALQGLAPDRVLYAGTVSKTLAPALRLGWLVVPHELVEVVHREQRLWNEGSPRIDQNALALLIESGAYDRHLRRMRRIYRLRRDTLLRELARQLPEAEVTGIAAGMHATVCLPEMLDETQLVRLMEERGVAVGQMSRHRIATVGRPTLLLGYGRASESVLKTGVTILADAVGKLRRRARVANREPRRQQRWSAS
jgi:GntR family transcriptional regulator/MocR family aminotransferase